MVAVGSTHPEQHHDSRVMDFYDPKNDVESVFHGFPVCYPVINVASSPFYPGQSADVHYQGKVIGWLGQLPQIAKALDFADQLIWRG